MSKFLITGLGNIGAEYSHTRHNIGFDVLDAFVQKHEGTFSPDRLADKAEIKWKGKLFVCIKPTTFMNLSGKAFKYWLDKEKIALEHTLTIVDDLALPLSKIRLRAGGSAAGHNGLRDIEQTLGTRQLCKAALWYWQRISKRHAGRICIGKMAERRAAGYQQENRSLYRHY